MTQDKTVPQRQVVYVLDDDSGVRVSLVELLRSRGIETRPFAQAEDLLAEIDHLEPGIFLIDVRLGSMSGLDVLPELARRDCMWPVAIITAHGDVPLAVQAVRAGAFDFLEKPFTGTALKAVIDRGMALLPEAAERSRRRQRGRRLILSLSKRQRQVFEGVVEGLTSKEIAIRLGLSHRTVEAYRQDMTAKLGTQSVADLFELKAVLAETVLEGV
jgi:two-component system response regulator FixJ